MKFAIFHVDKPYLNDEIFNPDSKLNRDNCLSFYRKLKELLAEIQIELHTQDMIENDILDIVIFADIPKNPSVIHKYPKKCKKIVLIYESEVIKPWNWDKNRHLDFDYIFTWNDDFIDNVKYFKFNFSFDPAGFVPINQEVKKKYDLVLMCGNHVSKHKKSLYHLRKELINFFEKNNDLNFKFWGPGWDKDFRLPALSNRYTKKLLSSFPIIFKNYKNYGGFAKDKIMILRESKFNFCIENATGFNGYITEKIFDCFKGRCIPIYLGPPNIQKFIPSDCYINFSQFKSMSELAAFIKGMTVEDQNAYLKNIDNFVNNLKDSEFTDSHNANNIKNIIQSIV